MVSEARMFQGEKVARADAKDSYPDWEVVDCLSYAELQDGEIWQVDMEHDGKQVQLKIYVASDPKSGTVLFADDGALLDFMVDKVQKHATQSFFERHLRPIFSPDTVSGLLAIATTVVVLVMAYQDLGVPRELWGLLGLVFGFFFGSKVPANRTEG
jgi:hypothetical protein